MGVFHVFKIVQTLLNCAKHYVIFLRVTHLVIQIMFVEVVGQKRHIFLKHIFYKP